MHLHPELLAAIEQQTALFDRGQLARAAAELTDRYKLEVATSRAISSDLHRAAYLAVRLPATYAAAAHVFRELHTRIPELAIESMLDLGSGPGTAFLAAKKAFPALRRATLLDADCGWQSFGRELCGGAAVETTWVQQDLLAATDFAPHDLVVISYGLGELPERAREPLLRRAWQSAQQALLIVEPGTKPGFAVVRGAREFLLNTGANLAAPCPHHQECPMATGGGISGRRGREDWCHFAQRVERTSMHRLLKSGVLGHEDEKFCYVAATPGSLRVPAARIVRHPQRHSGHVQLMLCTRQGLLRTIVTKSQKSIYKEARKAGWGDAWNLS